MRPADRLVVDQWRSLLPTAHLLTGTDAAARDLLARGLAAARRVPGTDDHDRAVAGLVRAHLSRWQARRDGSITGAATGAWWVSPDDAEAARRTSAALDRLTAAERTAVVLHWYEGLPANRVAALVPRVDLEAAARELAGEVPDPADLPARLDQLAAQCDLAGLTDETATAAVAAVGARGRRRVLLAGVAVAALTLGAVVAPGPAAGPEPAAAPAPGSLFTAGPTRGSLAGDGAFLDAARARMAAASGAVDDDPWAVVFAGDVQGVRAVFLLDAAGREPTWLTGPAGTPAAELASNGALGLPGQEAAAVAVSRPDGGGQVVLVVAAPRDGVELSPGIDVAADGTAGRTFRSLTVTDGVAVGVLDRGAAGSAQYRLVRDGVPLEPMGVIGYFPVSVSVMGEVGQPVPSRSGTPTASGFGYASALAAITGPTGYAADQLEVTVLGAGQFPAPGGETVEAVSLAAVLPSGAVVTTTGFGSSRTDGLGSTTASWSGCGSTGHPAGTDPAALTVAARCASYAGDSSTFGVTVVLAAPPGAVVALDDAAGSSPTVPELTRGWAFVIDDRDVLTRVAAPDAAGTVSREGADLFHG
ncbi:hypothetical protein GB931_05540 [Modestobacter sp. I12A-02628]|uniref:DNA-directed RNA polymerase specialized sigma24 family protein n=1 Tax=Goekera deserti TaxID=2497753 RepID=A0A7K3WBA6_9ACTN|nr:hypothetical protein [Goekera deserti]MPQ97396.1 hypothetical protein [Goekera deserti]NDI48003.1 hypothetical protein [Goekera deserti]NEL53751.1 hypothetical protein [Goekera deserti]